MAARGPDRIVGWRLAALIASAAAAAVLAAWWIVAPDGEPESTGQLASEAAAPRPSQPWGASPFGATGAAAPAEPEAPRLETPPARLPAPHIATPAQARAAPFSYVGQWVEGGRLAVILAHEGRSITVRGPGPLGGGYEVRAIDERRLVIVHLPTAVVHVIALGDAGAVGPGASAKAMSSPAADGDPAEEAPAPAVAVHRPNPPAPPAASTEEEPSN